MAEGGLKGKDYVWMWVTQDALSLPLVTADSSRMLAIKCGVNHSTIRSSVSKYEAGIIQGYPRYIRVALEEEADGQADLCETADGEDTGHV